MCFIREIIIILAILMTAEGFILQMPRPDRPFALDVGCGNGASTRAFQKKMPETIVIGMDIDMRCIQEAVRQDGFFLHGDAGDELFPADFFSFVQIRYSMLDIVNKMDVIEQLHRVMKHDGVIFLADYSNQHPILTNHPLSSFHDPIENISMFGYYFHHECVVKKHDVLYSAFRKHGDLKI